MIIKKTFSLLPGADFGYTASNSVLLLMFTASSPEQKSRSLVMPEIHLALVRMLSLFLFTSLSFGQISVLTWHYDNARTGANTHETILTPANVKSSLFGKLFTQPVDGIVVAQPLYLPNLTIPGVGVHNVVYVVTMHDTVYAFDADNNVGSNAAPLWQTSLVPPGATTLPGTLQRCNGETKFTEVGILSTPVIDPATGTIYVVAKTYENGVAVFRLHALDVSTGQEKLGGPVVISATFSGSGTNTTFNSLSHLNRPGLLLLNGNIYLGFGSNGCNWNNQGWVFAYDASSLQQKGVFTTEPGRHLASVWQKGAGLSADNAGNIYAEAAEGYFNPGTHFGTSVLKFSQVGNNLVVADWFAPYNTVALSAQDLDMNNAVLILPDQPGPHPHVAIASGKEGTIYVLDRDNMGQFCSTCTSTDEQIVQELSKATGLQPFSLVYWNNIVYSAAAGSPIKAFSLNDGVLSPTPVMQSVIAAGGHSPVISANGKSAGILWQINGSNLTAFDAITLKKLYASSSTNGRDTLPLPPHFSNHMQANGKIYVGTNTSLVVYGLF